MSSARTPAQSPTLTSTRTPARALARLLAVAAAALAGSAGVFLLSALSPRDPLAHSVAGWEFASPQSQEDLRAAYDTGGWAGAWWRWLVTVVTQGDAGYSRTLHAPVLQVIAERGLNTLAATALAVVLSALVTTGACALLAVRPQLARRGVLAGAVGVWLAVPSFLVALLIVVLLGDALPSPARTAPIVQVPAVAATIAIAWCAPLVASARAAAAEVWSTPWGHALVGRGIGARARFGLVLPHLVRPVLAYALLLSPQVLLGEAAVESVLAYPGIGNALVQAASTADLPLLASVTGIAAALACALLLVRGRRSSWTA